MTADSEPLRDWLVTFARKVAEERDYSTRHPGHVFTVMLRRDEAEGLLQQVNELVNAPAPDSEEEVEAAERWATNDPEGFGDALEQSSQQDADTDEGRS